MTMLNGQSLRRVITSGKTSMTYLPARRSHPEMTLGTMLPTPTEIQTKAWKMVGQNIQQSMTRYSRNS
ncbi:hypothetical protein HMPREF2559_12120 [Corynebacterium sp. HMSC072G08]|nr:hypothetical protein HMPREF2559_12120 [Corynebacterium sp. HMSC072G08]